jgi:hypothetical protein
MICDLGLNSEIPLLRPLSINKEFNYDRGHDGLLLVRLSSGEEIRAPVPVKRLWEAGWKAPSRRKRKTMQRKCLDLSLDYLSVSSGNKTVPT